jgi:hypothetical protein
MTQAVAVRRDGDAFQARIFWRKAACLLDPASPVAMVGFESGPKGFDVSGSLMRLIVRPAIMKASPFCENISSASGMCPSTTLATPI